MQIPEYIKIIDTDGKTVAFLSPVGDALKDCYPDWRLDGESTLEFSLPSNSPKLALITPECTIQAGGRIYHLLKDNATDNEMDDTGKLWTKFMTEEIWAELDSDYPEPYINNDPNTTPDDLTVTIVSGGSDLSGGLYPVGTAGHALYAITLNTGWSVGTVDVTGTFDLEDEQKSCLELIKKVQELWGGHLVWDSENKTVSLRDDTLWSPYNGFQFRYAKNLKNITRTQSNRLITKLYAFGKDGLNIASVNDGKKYITNFSYSTREYVGIYTNADIDDAQELKDKVIAELTGICKPKYNYTAKITDLRTLPEYSHEDFKGGDMVDVICDGVGANDRARIIRHRYNLFQPWDCDLELGDSVARLEKMVSDGVKAAYMVNKKLTPDIKSINNQIVTMNTSIEQTNEQIALKADKTVTDALGNRLTQAESSITINAEQIALRVEKTIYDTDMAGVTSRLDTAEQKITAEAITSTVRTSYDYQSDLITTQTNAVDASNTYTDGQVSPISSRLTTAETNITQNATAISLKADKTVTDDLGTRLTSAELKITDSAIVSTVRSSTEYTNDLAGKASTATTDGLQSQITQQAGEISLKVSASGVIASINASSEAISISANKINLSGYLSVGSAASDVNNGVTTINGSRITTGTLIVGTNVDIGTAVNAAGVTSIVNGTVTANYVNALGITAQAVTASWVYTGGISATQITSGTISADKISGGTLSGVTLNIDTDAIVGNSLSIGNYDGYSKYVYFNYGSYISTPGSTSRMEFSATGGLKFWNNIGFFGTSPASQQTASLLVSTATLSNVINTINGILNKLALYGLFSVS